MLFLFLSIIGLKNRVLIGKVSASFTIKMVLCIRVRLETNFLTERVD